MADDLAFDHVDHILGDVGGVVSDALQVPRDAEQVNQALDMFGMLQNALFDKVIHLFVHRIDLIVTPTDLIGQSAIHMDQGADAVTEHRLCLLRHQIKIQTAYQPARDVIRNRCVRRGSDADSDSRA